MYRVATKGLSATFTGDAGFLEEIEMMRKGSWAADVLKLGHHGSRFSTGDSWLDHVHPSIAIVSCGRDNSYGHPAQEVLDTCGARGIRVLRTDRDGTIALHPTGTGFTIGR
jgi:competence protein ComEC